MTTDDLLRTAMTVDDELDEIKRARVWARLEPQLAEGRCASSRAAVDRPRPGARCHGRCQHRHRSWPWRREAAELRRAARHHAVAPRRRRHPRRARRAGAARSDRALADDHGRSAAHRHLARGVRRWPRTCAAHPGARRRRRDRRHVVRRRSEAWTRPASRPRTARQKRTSAGRVQTITTGERACSDELAVQEIEPALRAALARQAAPTIASAPVPIVTPLPAEPPGAVVAVPVMPSTPPPPAPASVAAPPQIRDPGKSLTRGDPGKSLTRGDPAPVVESAPVAHDAPVPPVLDVAASAAASADRVAQARPIAPPRASTPPPAADQTAPPSGSAASPAQVVPVDAAALYAEAERELGTRNVAAADRNLARLVDEFPTSSLIDQAYYERARIAFDRRAWAAAQRDLDKLAQLPASSLAEPGAFLACRIAVEAHDGAAAECFAEYRAKYPRSPHDQDALGAIVDLEFHAGGLRTRARVRRRALRSVT